MTIFVFLIIETPFIMINLKGGNMLNTLMLVGRLASDIEVKKLDSGREVTNILLAVNRSFKNQDGTYDTDFINCTLWDGIAKSTGEYCKKGDLVGIRGRLQSDVYEKDDIKHHVLNVIAEKISFLASKKEEAK